MLQRFKDSQRDLERVLELESKNAAAQRELALVKKYFAEVTVVIFSTHPFSLLVICQI